MALASLDLPLPAWDDPFGLLLIGAVGLTCCLIALLVRRQLLHPAIRAVLGPLASGPRVVAFCLRGMFVPGNELFSRAPVDPRHPAEGVTVHKWLKVPEVYSAPDVMALGEIQQLLMGSNRRLKVSVVSGEPGRQAWSQDTIAIGPHYKSMQILDACEPRLMAVRQPAAFRGVNSSEVFEAKEGLDYGLIYKGRHPATHHSCWVVMGLGDPGTAAAAHFLHVHARTLGSLTGRRCFAAVISVDTGKGWESSVLRSLQPKPSWWRRLVYRKEWQKLTTTPWAAA